MSLLDMRPRGAGGGSGAPADATFITQTPNVTLTNEQALSLLATGLLKNTTGTGVLSIGTAGTDYLAPAAIGVTVQAWDADLDTLAGLAKVDGNFIVGDGAAWVVESGATARASLGLGALATVNDAPSDGSTYGRNNGAWAAVSAGLPVADTQTIIKGSADATKLLRFEIDGFAAGATRVLTPPNADATIAGLEVANVFTAIQKINVNNALALLVEQDGVKDNVLVVDTTNGRVGVLTAPSAYNFEVIGITDAATAIFNSSSAAVGTRVVIQGTAANSNSGTSDPIVSFRNRLGNQVALVREDGLIGSTNLGTTDDSSAFLIDSTVETAAYPRGVNLGSSSILGWSSGPWYFGKDITLSRSAVAQMSILGSDAGTGSILEIIKFRHNTSGTPGTGYGIGLVFESQSSTTINQPAGRLTYEWATATHASRKARSKWTVYDTAEREGIRIEANGSSPMLGFLGASAIARPSTYTLASTATRTMPTPESAFTGQDNAQPGSVYAKSADLITLQTRLDSVEGVLRQLIIDLASTSGYGLLVAA